MEQTPRLLDQVRHAIRLRHYSFSTERTYVGWIRRFIDLNYRQIAVHDGKGSKDRRTLLPDCVTERLKEQLICVKTIYLRDIDSNFCGVSLPHAPTRKYPKAGY